MTYLLKKYDLFICSAGYEDRTMAGLKALCSRTKIKNSIINFYEVEEFDLQKANEKNIIKIKKLLKKLGNDSPLVLITNPTNLTKFEETINTCIKNSETILVDITSFTRLFLYSLLSCLKEHSSKVHFVYSEPRDYTHNLSHGLEEIIIHPSFSGIPNQSKKILMILFLGWEIKRAEYVVKEFDPDKLITVVEESHDLKRDYWNRITVNYAKKLIQDSPSEIVQALNPTETLIKLESLYKQYSSDYDFCIMNIGPKPQCLAICEFAFKHQDVQILYPKPYLWMEESSKKDPKLKALSVGAGSSFIFEFP